ncbi:protein phosphatase CheZ [Methylobacillus caricis]|uniref:protein phosphatase CheZ n=1 Tax=Methylobacillus caricis TaxID=1971611 RepID=UPI001CFFA3F3|nr:protein phosphatase CheZ [Methylobacillus caricis]MCB5187961.1 protein phosphatase CheZ [Methylobacillus caricis]
MNNSLHTTGNTNNEAENVLNPQDEMLKRIGLMTRSLHESLRGLGFDKLLEQAAHGIPDARDRLNYVARMTEQAAERVLNATDIATPLQAELNQQATDLESRWKALLSVPSLKKEYDQVADETLAFLSKTVVHTDVTKEQLLDIMMAQDFQDLTGQVIKKITELAQEIEKQLLQVLIDFSPGHAKKEDDGGLLNGPQINPETAVDVVASQEQVDDLLDSLGF